MTLEVALERGMVPTDRVAPILRAELEERFDGDTNVPQAGTLPRVLNKWENGQPYAEFNGVDKIFAKLGITSLWYGDLNDLYLAVNLDAKSHAEKRCERNGCSELIIFRVDGGQKKRFCSPKCRQAAYTHRSGKYRPKRIGVCHHGHERSPQNTRTLRNGITQCRVCAKLTARKRRAREKVAA